MTGDDLSRVNFRTWLSRLIFNGKASTYFVKWSTNVSKYLLLLEVIGYGLVMSMDVTSKGIVGISTSASGALSSRSSFHSWQGSYFWIYSFTDLRILGHQ